MPRLRRADCSSPGIRRVRRGRGFSFSEEDGTTVQDAETLERIRELAIPPAWEDVWICPFPNGHIQATGLDAAGRKQYLYHHQLAGEPRPREIRRDAAIRPRPASAAREGRSGPRPARLRRASACSPAAFASSTSASSGSAASSTPTENETFGLTTLRKRHLRFERGAAVFDYSAKGAKRHVQELADPDVVKLLRGLAKRNGGGHELLAYRDGREWVDVKAADVNAYLKETAGGDFSAKDFRTWNATVLAAAGLAVRAAENPPKSKTARARIANAVVKDVARLPREHPRGMPRLLHRPAGLRPLRLRRAAARPAEAGDRGLRPGRLRGPREDRAGRGQAAALSSSAERLSRCAAPQARSCARPPG